PTLPTRCSTPSFPATCVWPRPRAMGCPAWCSTPAPRAARRLWPLPPRWSSASKPCNCAQALFHVKPSNVLILPGWQNSTPDHWQSRWEALYGYRRVDQHDWMRPRRGDWLARLEEVVLDASEPVVLVAHSLGCILTAAWAAHSKNTHRVKAALLVAPGDAEHDTLHDILPSWSPIPMVALPFHSLLVGS